MDFGNTSTKRDQSIAVPTFPQNVQQEFLDNLRGKNGYTEPEPVQQVAPGKVSFASDFNPFGSNPPTAPAPTDSDPFDNAPGVSASDNVANLFGSAPVQQQQEPQPVVQQQQQAQPVVSNINNEEAQLVGVLKGILKKRKAENNMEMATVGELSKNIKTITGKSWGGHWAKEHGTLTNFAKNHADSFTLVRNKYIMLKGDEGLLSEPAEKTVQQKNDVNGNGTQSLASMSSVAQQQKQPQAILPMMGSMNISGGNPFMQQQQQQQQTFQQTMYGGGMQQPNYGGMQQTNNPFMQPQQPIQQPFGMQQPMMQSNPFMQQQQQPQVVQPNMNVFNTQQPAPVANTTSSAFDPFDVNAGNVFNTTAATTTTAADDDWFKPSTTNNVSSFDDDWGNPLAAFDTDAQAEKEAEEELERKKKEAKAKRKAEKKMKKQQQADEELAKKLQDEEYSRAGQSAPYGDTSSGNTMPTTLSSLEMRKLAEKEIGMGNVRVLSGFSVKKFGREGRPHQRKMWITAGLTHLAWESGQYDSHRGIELCKVTDIMVGQMTQNIQRSSKDYDKVKALCFSLVTTHRTLDLQACSVVQRDTLVAALRKTLEFNRKYKPQRISKDATKIQLPIS